MKGYLQRLVASASRPERRVRPFVGSIYAEGARETSMEEARPMMAGQIAEDAARVPAARATEAQPIRASREAAAIEPLGASRPYAPEPPRFTPLLPRKDAETGAGILQIEDARLDSLAPLHRQPEIATRKQEPEREALLLETRVSSQPLVLQPPMLEERSGEWSPEAGAPLVPIREPLRKTSAQEARRESQQQAASRAPERGANEEIQIHIGRIEVIAAPPPPARAAAAPARRFTSLDDYLKRRDGRAE
jgi:hypothetical protein